MKSILVTALFFLFSSSLTSIVLAENQTNHPFNPQDTEAIKKNAEALGNLFGIDRNKTKQEPTAPQQQKSMADVAEKAIDMTAQAVATIASTIQKIAPDIWRIMLKQQYVKGIAGLIVPFGLLFLLFLYGKRVAPKCFPVPTEENCIQEDSDEKWTRIWFANILPVGLAFVFGLWGICRLSDCLGYLINPEFYAIQDLLRTILQP